MGRLDDQSAVLVVCCKRFAVESFFRVSVVDEAAVESRREDFDAQGALVLFLAQVAGAVEDVFGVVVGGLVDDSERFLCSFDDAGYESAEVGFQAGFFGSIDAADAGWGDFGAEPDVQLLFEEELEGLRDDARECDEPYPPPGGDESEELYVFDGDC